MIISPFLTLLPKSVYGNLKQISDAVSLMVGSMDYPSALFATITLSIAK